MVVKVNLTGDANTMQQKGPLISTHLHDQVEEELKRLTKSSNLERATEINEDCSVVSPAEFTIKKANQQK